jgi:hypothetical protein
VTTFIEINNCEKGNGEGAGKEWRKGWLDSGEK